MSRLRAEMMPAETEPPRPNGIADGQHPVAHPADLAVAEASRMASGLVGLHLQQRDIRLRIRADQRRVQRGRRSTKFTVISSASFDHVVVRDHEALRPRSRSPSRATGRSGAGARGTAAVEEVAEQVLEGVALRHLLLRRATLGALHILRRGDVHHRRATAARPDPRSCSANAARQRLASAARPPRSARLSTAATKPRIARCPAERSGRGWAGAVLQHARWLLLNSWDHPAGWPSDLGADAKVQSSASHWCISATEGHPGDRHGPDR